MKSAVNAALLCLAASLIYACDEVRFMKFDTSEVHYTRSVTRAEAARLGEYLSTSRIPIANPFLVKLDKEGLDYRIYWAGSEDFRVFGSNMAELASLADSISFHLFKGRSVKLMASDKDFKTRLAVDQTLGQSLPVGEGYLYYQRGVSLDLADSMGQVLLEKGFFSSPRAAQLSKAGDAWYLKIENTEDDYPSGEMIREANDLCKDLEERFFPDSWMVIEICNRFLQTQTTIKPDPYIHSISYGTDKISYSDDVLKREAHKLGDFLSSQNVLRNTHQNVGVFKKKDAYMVSFKALRGVDNPESQAKARRMAIALSKHVFRGEEVKVHLYDRGREHLIFSSTD